MVQISKNLIRGRRVTSPNQILQASDERRSLVWYASGDRYMIKPAAAFANWPLRLIMMQISCGKLYETKPKPDNAQ